VKRLRVWHLLVLMVPVALFAVLASGVQRARRAANESSCHGRMFFIYAHLISLRDRRGGAYPPTVDLGADGTPMHSWRAFVLAEVGAYPCTYDLMQPWNSAANLKAAGENAAMYACPNNQGRPPRFTNYVAVVDRGVSTLARASAIPQGSPEEARQVLLIEYPNSDIPWAEPRDLDVNELSKLTAGSDPGGLGVLFADGTYLRLPLAEVLNLFGRGAGGPRASGGSHRSTPTGRSPSWSPWLPSHSGDESDADRFKEFQIEAGRSAERPAGQP